MGGEQSKVSSTLREVESNFEDFVVEAQIWASNSIADIYSAIKNIQKAMKKGNNALVYQKATNGIVRNPKTFRDRQNVMEALVHEREEMNHYLSLVPPVLEQMINKVADMRMMLKNKMMIQIRDAKTQTLKEIHQNQKSDKAAKFGKTRLSQDIQRTDDYLKQIAADIAKSEHDLMKNAENIQKYIDRKEKHRANFRQKIQNKQLKKFELIRKQERALTNYQTKMRENLRHLNSRQMKGCDNKAFKQCIRGSSSQAQACFNKALSSYSSNQACRVEASEYL